MPSKAEIKKMRDEFKKTGELPPHLKKMANDLKKFKVKHKVKDIVVPGMEWMSKLGEERDYKDEYKKFQSSTKSKKYRAELNKYNRKKGTYGNGDGKDASHKGGKIVGFEKESKNRGRAEKSRLKKENSMNKLNEEQYFNPNGEFKKYMDKVFKQAGIKVIKFDPMKQSFWNGTWGGFYTVKSSNKIDIGGKPVPRGSAVLPVYISRVGEIQLGVSAKGFHLGKAGSSSVVKNLIDFRKEDLGESIDENILNENPAAMAAATAMTKMKMKNPKTGKDVSAASALKNKDNPNHKKAKSIFQKLKDRFTKKKKEEPKKQSKSDSDFYKRQFAGEEKIREYIRSEIKNGNITSKSLDETNKQTLLNIAKIMKGTNESVTEHTVTFTKDDMEKLHSSGEVIKADPDGKEHTYVYKEYVKV